MSAADLDLLFARALELGEAEREAWLAALTRERPEDARELAELLRHHDSAGDFLERAAVLEPGLAADPGAGAMPERIGSYRVLGLLGEGGMGVVWLAEQESPRRTVALKVLRPALASPRQLARFEREAELLGRLTHHGIARIYEAGVADAGAGPQPFFAMEHVHGRPLDRYAAEEGLSTRERLALVAEVCDAVEHAHAHGIVHRDLKPSNVLVDDTTGEREIKVLDFGVARASGAETVTTAARTAVGQLIGTLPYMSPEQAAGDPDAVDARADVYALGVLAYELVSGRRPYDLEGRTLLEAVRVIREVEPTPLSTVQRVLRGDVETIVGKALEKDPARRYASAGELGGDLRRWLADRPILARPPSATYQLSKLARRHKALFAGVAATFLALLAGLAVALRQNELLRVERDRAQAARRNAEIERRNADAVATWFEALLSRASPWQGKRDVTLREVLELGSRELPAEVLAVPAIEARVRGTLGVVLQTLGDSERAEEELTRALERARVAFGEEHETTLSARTALAGVTMRRGEWAQAEAELSEAFEGLLARVGEADPRTLEAGDMLASARTQLGRFEPAEAWLRRSPAMHRARGDEARALEAENNLGMLLLATGRLDEAIELLQRAYSAGRELQGARHPNTMMKANSLASALQRAGRTDEAVPLRFEIVESAREVLGDDHLDTWTCRLNLGVTLIELGRFDEGLPLLRATLAARERLLGPSNVATSTARNNLAQGLQRTGAYEEAEDLYLRTLQDQEALPDGGGANAALTRQNLGLVRVALGRPELGCEDLREALATLERILGPAHWQTASVRTSLGTALRAAGRREEAERELAAGLAGLETALGADHPRTRAAAANLAALQAELAGGR